MTNEKIIEIYNYCIGGYDIPFATMKKEVISFMSDIGVSNEELNDMKESERANLELEGYFDY